MSANFYKELDENLIADIISNNQNKKTALYENEDRYVGDLKKWYYPSYLIFNLYIFYYMPIKYRNLLVKEGIGIYIII